MDDKIKNYVETHKKSPSTGVILAVLFGPIGLLYSNPALSIGAIAVGFTAVQLSLPIDFVAIIVWILSAILGFTEASSYNKRLESKAALIAVNP